MRSSSPSNAARSAAGVSRRYASSAGRSPAPQAVSKAWQICSADEGKSDRGKPLVHRAWPLIGRAPTLWQSGVEITPILRQVTTNSKALPGGQGLVPCVGGHQGESSFHVAGGRAIRGMAVGRQARQPFVDAR